MCVDEEEGNLLLTDDGFVDVDVKGLSVRFVVVLSMRPYTTLC